MWNRTLGSGLKCFDKGVRGQWTFEIPAACMHYFKWKSKNLNLLKKLEVVFWMMSEKATTESLLSCRGCIFHSACQEVDVRGVLKVIIKDPWLPVLEEGVCLLRGNLRGGLGQTTLTLTHGEICRPGWMASLWGPGQHASFLEAFRPSLCCLENDTVFASMGMFFKTLSPSAVKLCPKKYWFKYNNNPNPKRQKAKPGKWMNSSQMLRNLFQNRFHWLQASGPPCPMKCPLRVVGRDWATALCGKKWISWQTSVTQEYLLLLEIIREICNPGKATSGWLEAGWQILNLNRWRWYFSKDTNIPSVAHDVSTHV